MAPAHHEDLRRIEAEAKDRLAKIVRMVMDDAVPAGQGVGWRVRLHVRRGRPDEQIVALSDETLSDLIVVGRFGQSAHGMRGIGSVADRVVAAAESPVLVVHMGRERSAADRQCPDCVRVRSESDGEQWFCERHHGEHVHHSALLDAMTGTSPIGGGPMW